MTSVEKSDNAEAAIPNLFLVGAMKSGTTSVASYLTSHDKVYAPKIKEPNHFGSDLHRHRHRIMALTIHNFANIHNIANRNDYLSLYHRVPKQSKYIVDASPSYLYSTDAADNIATFNPDAKIVILLRDPVVRAWSEYRMNLAIGIERRSFAEAVRKELEILSQGQTFLLKRYIYAGYYGEQIERYLRSFSRENIFIDVVDHPLGGLGSVMERLFRFLDLEPNPGRELIHENEGKLPAYKVINNALYFSGAKALVSNLTPDALKNRAKTAYYQADRTKISDTDREFLAPLFSDSNKKLRDLTGVDINHWARGEPMGGDRRMNPMAAEPAKRSGRAPCGSHVGRRLKIAFAWDQFGEYHCDRCEGVAAAAAEHEIVGIEFCRSSRDYPWPPTGPGQLYTKVTLFEDVDFEATSWAHRLVRLLRVAARCDVIFLAGYGRADNFFAAMILRCLGRRVLIMNDSKFDDKPRRASFEWIKGLALLPYQGALVAGARQAGYLRFLGFGGPITTGYDSVSLGRLRDYLGDEAAMVRPFGERSFLFVGRMVPKKNLHTLIRAYGLYRSARGDLARGLVLVGDGPLRAEVGAQIAALGLRDHVTLTGFLDPPAVARAMNSALCLVTPSNEEQWGLVINEALAFDLPVVASTVVGATETLVRNGVNGFLVEADNAEGLAFMLGLVDDDEQLWRRLRDGARAMADRGDIARFVEGACEHWQ